MLHFIESIIKAFLLNIFQNISTRARVVLSIFGSTPRSSIQKRLIIQVRESIFHEFANTIDFSMKYFDFFRIHVCNSHDSVLLSSSLKIIFKIARNDIYANK
eukprot:UN18130